MRDTQYECQRQKEYLMGYSDWPVHMLYTQLCSANFVCPYAWRFIGTILIWSHEQYSCFIDPQFDQMKSYASTSDV